MDKYQKGLKILNTITDKMEEFIGIFVDKLFILKLIQGILEIVCAPNITNVDDKIINKALELGKSN